MIDVNDYDMKLKNGIPHFTKPTKKKTTLLVVRGHQTKDIQGVVSVVGRYTLDAILPLIARHDPVNILLEDSQITKLQAKEHCKVKQSVIYVGGTAMLWYRLRNTIRHTIDTDNGCEQFNIVKPFKYSCKPVCAVEIFMIYEQVFKNKTLIAALYGASPYGTLAAVKTYIEMEPLRGTRRLLIGKFAAPNAYSDLVFSFEN